MKRKLFECLLCILLFIGEKLEMVFFQGRISSCFGEDSPGLSQLFDVSLTLDQISAHRGWNDVAITGYYACMFHRGSLRMLVASNSRVLSIPSHRYFCHSCHDPSASNGAILLLGIASGWRYYKAAMNSIVVDRGRSHI